MPFDFKSTGILAFFFLVLLGLASCEKEEIQPIDPGNPTTGITTLPDSTDTGMPGDSTSTDSVDCSRFRALVGPAGGNQLIAYPIPLRDTIGATYLWSTGETTQAITPTATASYSVTITNAEGCIASDERDFTYVDPALCVDFAATITVNGDQLTVEVTGQNLDGLTFAWTTDDTTATITARASGFYGITVGNADGCSTMASIDFVAEEEEENCDELTLEVAADGDVLYAIYPRDFAVVSYDWSNGETTENILVTESGTYTLTITTAGGCVATASFEFEVDEPQEEDCDELTLEIGADGDVLFPYYPRDFAVVSYAWSNGETTQNILVTESGLYTLTITTAGGCVATASFEYEVDEPQEEDCDELTLEIGADGDVLYPIYPRDFEVVNFEWSTGATDYNILVVESGVYTLTITTAGGCTATASFEYEADEPQEENCDELRLEIGADGDVLYPIFPRNFTVASFLWSTGSTEENIQVVESGTYTLVISTVGGCDAVASFEYVNPQNDPCDGFSVAVGREGNTLFTSLQGGSQPFTYSWSDGSTESTLELPANPAAGYSVTVTDANGCTVADGIEL
ncbi:MAG: hypothetical protein AAF840_07285 [Bacteroidota bacterium]